MEYMLEAHRSAITWMQLTGFLTLLRYRRMYYQNRQL